jgi:hypothetical protein
MRAVLRDNGLDDGIVVPPALFEGRAAELFVAGRADVTASASAADQDVGETAWSNAATTIVLRGGGAEASATGSPEKPVLRALRR